MKLLLKFFCCLTLPCSFTEAWWVQPNRRSISNSRSSGTQQSVSISISGGKSKGRYTSLVASDRISTIGSNDSFASSFSVEFSISSIDRSSIFPTSSSSSLFVIGNTSTFVDNSWIFTGKSSWHRTSIPPSTQSQSMMMSMEKSEFIIEISTTTDVKDSFAISNTLSQTQTLISTATKSLITATNPVSKQAKASTIAASLGTVSIEPNRSMVVLMTSTFTCTCIETVEFDVTLKAELSQHQINKTLLEIICMEANQVCYNIKDDQCKRSKSADRISLDDLRIIGDHISNETSTTIKIQIHSACTEQSMLKSKRLKTELGVNSVTVCRKSGHCTSKLLKSDTTISSSDDKKFWFHGGRISAIVVGVVMVALLIFVGFLYAWKKRLMTVHAETESEERKSKNAEISSSTSQC